MENLIEKLYIIFIENTFFRWLALAFLSIVLTAAIKSAIKIFSKKMKAWTEHTPSSIDDIALEVLDSLRPSIVFVVIFFLLTRSLEQSENLNKTLLILTILAIVSQIVIWGMFLIKKWRELFLDKKIKDNPSSAAAAGLIYTGVQIVFIVLVLLVALNNLGVDITALLAGLGVGGIAVALAAQNVLGDLLASLSIVFDKPFVVGDFIVAGNEKGTVEYIGIKTTRLRALSGEQLVLSNKDLLESRIQNYKRMQMRRVVLKFGVVYSTPSEILAKIPIWVKEIVELQEVLQFDRCHFFSYGSFSLDFELVFFVRSADYNIYMDLQQIVLLKIYNKFSIEKIDFAFPTQSLFIEKMPDSHKIN